LSNENSSLTSLYELLNLGSKCRPTVTVYAKIESATAVTESRSARIDSGIAT
jgi:hypothetical protein